MKNIRIEIKWALIFIVMMFLWMLMEKLLGYHDEKIDKHTIITNFVAIPAILIYVLALIDKRNNFYSGKITYKQAFISGMIISLIVTAFTPLTQYITSAYITPDYFENAINYAVESGEKSQEEAEAYFNMKNYIISSTLFTPVMGIATTAVVGIFVRKK